MHGHSGHVFGRQGIQIGRLGSPSPHKNDPVNGPSLPIAKAERPWPGKKCLQLIGLKSEAHKTVSI